MKAATKHVSLAVADIPDSLKQSINLITSVASRKVHSAKCLAAIIQEASI